MWADGLVSNRMLTETFINYSNCLLNKEGDLKEGNKEFRNINDLQWRSPDENPYITNNNDKKRLLDTFNRKCEIIKTIQS